MNACKLLTHSRLKASIEKIEVCRLVRNRGVQTDVRFENRIAATTDGASAVPFTFGLTFFPHTPIRDRNIRGTGGSVHVPQTVAIRPVHGPPDAPRRLGSLPGGIAGEMVLSWQWASERPILRNALTSFQNRSQHERR